MAFQTNLSLINLTPYDWTGYTLAETTGLIEWDFPKTLASGDTYQASIVIDTSHGSNPTQAKADWPFSWIDQAHPVADLKISVSGDDGDGADYSYAIDATLEQFGTQRNPKGSTISIPLYEDAWSPFLLVGDNGSLAGNNPPLDWMEQNLGLIGCLTLQDIVLPGSHDSGMSQINYAHGGTADNSQTQTLSVLGQLEAGVRYFDVRPSISHGQFYTGHYTDELGANGESMADIVSDVNAFTGRGFNELVVLELSHSLDTDSGYGAFSDAQYRDLLTQLSRGLEHLYTGHASDVLTTVRLSDFISSSPAVVVVCDERDKSWLSANGFLGKGFYGSGQMPVYNSYADTTELDTMRQDQWAKFSAQAKNPDTPDQLFLLSWTFTQDVLGAIGIGLGIGADGGADGTSIRDSAAYFNGFLAQTGGAVPYTGPLEWAKKAGKPPNIIMIDNVPTDNRFLATLCLGMTRWFNRDEKC
ncbi:hypothetical protein PV08_10926 [Exophiala spinifera]|uniref:Phosphatidylinositol-specific phospholipase C X domain-containing protein n=1 Tax=Exophiala spinifera TaxID=91928 RepID=A0A0D2BK23_9EURO|nr:uncharacterized protein PV08_10926 [Exophiala spinifera]KIW11624.1 hypothetical protein PV08_10926 [Exophiala spinifera]